MDLLTTLQTGRNGRLRRLFLLFAILPFIVPNSFAEDLTLAEKIRLDAIKKILEETLPALGDSVWEKREAATVELIELLPTDNIKLMAAVAKEMEQLSQSTQDIEIRTRLDLLVYDFIKPEVNQKFLADIEEWNQLPIPGMAHRLEEKWFADDFAWLIDPNTRTEEGFTPLMLAAKNLDLELVPFLIRKGANKELKDYRGSHAYKHASASAGRLLKAFSEAYFYDNPKKEAFAFRHPDLLEEAPSVEQLAIAGEILQLLRTTEGLSHLETGLESAIVRYRLLTETEEERKKRQLERLIHDPDSW